MPRRSAASAAAAADLGASSTISLAGAAGASNIDGDTSIMSATTDVSPSTKPPKTSTKADKVDADNTGIDDLLLPRTLTSRLARGTLPPNTSIQKDALLALTKAASVFISYLASHSNEVTTKKTIGPQDVLKAIQEIEMGSVMGLGEIGPDGKVGGRLERELEVWETVVRGKRKGYREKVKMRESGAGGEGRSSENGEGGNKEGEGEEREAKRPRVEEEEEEGDAGAERSDGGYDEQQATSPHPDDASNARELTNGTTRGKAHNDLPDGDDEGEDDGYEDGSAEGDETQPDDEDEPEDEDDEPAPDDDDDLDGYGPDDQLRHDMNGDVTGDESE